VGRVRDRFPALTAPVSGGDYCDSKEALIGVLAFPLVSAPLRSCPFLFVMAHAGSHGAGTQASLTRDALQNPVANPDGFWLRHWVSFDDDVARRELKFPRKNERLGASPNFDL
jgi:hypothetical protein